MFPRVYPQPSAEAESFIRFILEVEPGKRPNAQDALRHPWIAGVDAMHGRHRSGVGVQFDHGELRVAQNEMAALETE